MTDSADPSPSVLLAICGPSGAGKSSVARALRAQEPSLVFSIAATTRPPRPGEADAGVYRFVSDQEFERLVRHDGLLEHAERFGHRYGELRQPTQTALEQHCDVLFDTDIAGAARIGAALGRLVVTVGLLPPSTAELRRRLSQRHPIDIDHLEARMHQVGRYVEMACSCDHVVVNDDLDATIADVRAILRVERVKVRRPAVVHAAYAAFGLKS